MLKYKAVDNKAQTCGMICEDGLKRAREVEGLKWENFQNMKRHLAQQITEPRRSLHGHLILVLQLGPCLEGGGGG
jgi:hypothetical protein